MNKLHVWLNQGIYLCWTCSYTIWAVKQHWKRWHPLSLNQRASGVTCTLHRISEHNTCLYWVPGHCGKEGNEKSGRTDTEGIGDIWGGHDRGDIWVPTGIPLQMGKSSREFNKKWIVQHTWLLNCKTPMFSSVKQENRVELSWKSSWVRQQNDNLGLQNRITAEAAML